MTYAEYGISCVPHFCFLDFHSGDVDDEVVSRFRNIHKRTRLAAEIRVLQINGKLYVIMIRSHIFCKPDVVVWTRASCWQCWK